MPCSPATHPPTCAPACPPPSPPSRDEQLDEARADLADMKELFRTQLEHLMAQLEEARQGDGSGGGGGGGGGGALS
jgi:hypothetical protein